MTSGDIYPGVPLVSMWLSFTNYLAIPRSVSFTYPLWSTTKFSGFKSLWIILCLFKNSSDKIIHALVNLVSDSLKTLFLEICSRISPPVNKSIISYKVCESWNPYYIFTKKSKLRFAKILRSFITLLADFLVIIFILDISFIAYSFCSIVLYTDYTLPNPPIPTTFIFL